MEYESITEQYYSKWLGVKNVKFCSGVHFVYSEERNKIPFGYSHPFNLYIFCQPQRIIVSYGDYFREMISELKVKILPGMTAAEIKSVLNMKIGHSVKYVFDKLPGQPLCSKVLQLEDYPYYSDFYVKSNPGSESDKWLYEYFAEMVQQHTCCGVFDNDVLVSCSDAPGMPYMADKVQEIGINTLKEYRGKGYAVDACITCAKQIIRNGKCPIWSTKITNIASQKVAEKVGFIKWAEVLTV